MELLLWVYITALLIAVLIELIDLRKESATKLKWQKKYQDAEESITAHKGWGTKYREDIQELENKIDESKVLAESLLTKVKKSEMENAKELVKIYYKM